MTERHYYRLCLRPASIGCYSERDADGNPLTHEITETHWPPVRTPDGRNHYATVAYAEPLTFAQVWHYDLQSVDAVEAARYLFWEYYDRGPDKVAYALPLWLRLPAEHLRQMVADGDDARGKVGDADRRVGHVYHDSAAGNHLPYPFIQQIVPEAPFI